MRRMLGLVFIAARFLAASLLAASLLLGGSCRADQPTAKIKYAADALTVWSSADEGRYPAGQLLRGTRLEVYQQAAGWLAIRPPEECFSWIRADMVQPTDDDSIVIVRVDGARSWIGGESPDVAPEHPQTQVTLQIGESLRKLGQSNVTAPSGKVLETWYRIAPPAGEFRWVRASETRSAPPKDVAAASNNVHLDSRPAENSPAENSHSGPSPADRAQVNDRRGGDADPASRTAAASPRAIESAKRSDEPTVSASGATAKAGAAAGSAEQGAWRPRGSARADATRTATDLRRADMPDSSDAAPLSLDHSVAAAARQRLAARGVTFDEQLNDLDLRFSTMVARPPDRWDLAAVIQEASVLAMEGADPLQRGRARKLLEELNAFDELQRRRRRLDSGELVDEILAQNARRREISPLAPLLGRNGRPIEDGLQDKELDEDLDSAEIERGLRIRRASARDTLQDVDVDADDARDVAGARDSDADPAAHSDVGIDLPIDDPTEGPLDGHRRKPSPTAAPPEQSGWLLPVQSREADSPPYALIDGEGEVICFVEPGEDLELSDLVKSHVVIRGQRRHVARLRRDLWTVHAIRPRRVP